MTKINFSIFLGKFFYFSYRIKHLFMSLLQKVLPHPKENKVSPVKIIFSFQSKKLYDLWYDLEQKLL